LNIYDHHDSRRTGAGRDSDQARIARPEFAAPRATRSTGLL